MSNSRLRLTNNITSISNIRSDIKNKYKQQQTKEVITQKSLYKQRSLKFVCLESFV